MAGEPDDGSGGTCPPDNCLNYDVAEYVVDADGMQIDDGLDDQEGTAEQYAIIERPIGGGCDPQLDSAYAFARVYAWQFRYDTARARYMRRMLDPETLEPASTEWSDYDGDEVLGDFTIEGTWPSEYAQQERLYFGAVAHVDVDENGAWTDDGFYHDNHLGSTEVLSGPSGDVTRRIVYTAFGEPANLWPGAPEGAAQTRYLYAGAWGYESDAASPFLHVGYRWYDPETGRFLQRDPIGLRGGLNPYEYVDSHASGSVDPSGLDRWFFDTGFLGHHYVIMDNPSYDPSLPKLQSSSYLRLDFYGRKHTGRLFDKGMMMVSPCFVLDSGGRRISSTHDEDVALEQEARRIAKNPPGYNYVLHNCQHMARYLAKYGTDPGRWVTAPSH